MRKFWRATLIFFSVGTLVLCFFVGCSTGPSLQSLAVTDPARLIGLSDSLQKARQDDPELITLLTQAHVALGDQAYKDQKWSPAVAHYSDALELSPRDRGGRYGLAMTEGRQYFKQGSRNQLWEAIIKFGEAAVIDTANGRPDYWLARSYEKKNDQDFDLIIEAFNSSLSHALPDDLRADAEERLREQLRRKKLYEDFWK